MLVSKHFKIQEFVPEHIFAVHGKRSTRFIRAGMFQTAQKLRDVFGTTTINDWVYGGRRNWSGYRDSSCENLYSPLSAHSFGEAIDCIFKTATAEEVRKYIMDNQDEFPFITRMESKVGWLHADGLFTGTNVRETTGIIMFDPPTLKNKKREKNECL